MSLLFVLAILAINIAISWYNAVLCGRHWSESKVLGGFPRLLMWCGALQSAIGFSMILVMASVFGAHALGYLPPKAMHAAMSLWYLLIIVPAIGSGLVLTIHSWVVAWRERSWQSIGSAAWNTYASASNMYDAFDGGLADSLADVGKLFDGDDDLPSSIVKLVLLLVAISLIGGVLLTALLIRKHDRLARRELAAAPAFA